MSTPLRLVVCGSEQDVVQALDRLGALAALGFRILEPGARVGIELLSAGLAAVCACSEDYEGLVALARDPRTG